MIRPELPVYKYSNPMEPGGQSVQLPETATAVFRRLARSTSQPAPLRGRVHPGKTLSDLNEALWAIHQRISAAHGVTTQDKEDLERLGTAFDAAASKMEKMGVEESPHLYWSKGTLDVMKKNFAALQRWVSEQQAIAPSEVPPLSPELLRNIPKIPQRIPVEVQKGCGNKHRNLQEMHNLICEASNLEGVLVPLPFGLSDGMVREFLEKRAPRLSGQWGEFCARYAEYRAESQQTPFFKIPEVEMLLLDMQGSIRQAFVDLDERDIQLLDIDGKLSQWLQEMREKGTLLMVRSTGDEDSTYANAGGNESLAYIPPDLRSVIQALGTVVASYYSVPSLANRIAARDEVTASPPKCAVLLQELVGEPVGGVNDPENIPVSITLFSNEPEYGGSEKFRIMRVGATYGHGEAVVGNLGIATDTFYVLQSRINPEELCIVSDIKEKTQRLAPLEGESGIELRAVDNDPSMARQPCLSHEMLRRLLQLAKIVEAGKGEVPQDMELVVKGGIIYPVQTRPVNRLQRQMTASYVAPETYEKVPAKQRVIGRTQVVGSGNVVQITSQDQVVVGETLEECEARFNPRIHKMAVYRAWEPSTSHPTVNFSGLGIPCIQIDNWEAGQNIIRLASSYYPVVADVQRGELLKTSPEAPLLIKEGWAQHPVNPRISFSLPILSGVRERLDLLESTSLREIGKRLQMAQTTKKVEGVISDLFAHPTMERLQATEEGLESRLAEQPSRGSLQGRVTVAGIKLLNQRIRIAAAELKEAVKAQAPRLEVLFHAGVLKNLLIPDLRSGQSLGQLSLLNLDPLVDQAETLFRYPTVVQLDTLLLNSSLALNSGESRAWESFIRDLEEDPGPQHPKVQQLAKVLEQLRSCNAISGWMTLVFGRINHSLPAQEQLDLCLAGCTSESISLMEIAVKKQQEIAGLRTLIPGFGNPSQFKDCWERLQIAVKEFSSEQWLQQVKSLRDSGNLPGIMIAVQALEQFVDLFDQSIKSMKGSTQYTPEQKLIYMRDMVEEYSRLLYVWTGDSDLINDRDFALERIGIPGVQSIATVMAAVKANWDQKIDPNAKKAELQSLQRGINFSVGSATLGSAALIERSLPQTLEDHFTLVHQNLMVVAGAISQRSLSWQTLRELPITNELKALIKGMQVLGPEGRQLYRFLGLRVDAEGIVLSLNRPLRNHSMTVKIAWDAVTNTITLQVNFWGEARVRWAALDALFTLLADQNVIYCEKKTSSGPMHLTHTLRVTPENLDATLLWIKKEGDATVLNTESELIKEALANLQPDRALAKYWKNPSLAEFAIKYFLSSIEQSPVQRLSLGLYKLLPRIFNEVGVSKEWAGALIKWPRDVFRIFRQSLQSNFLDARDQFYRLQPWNVIEEMVEKCPEELELVILNMPVSEQADTLEHLLPNELVAAKPALAAFRARFKPASEKELATRKRVAEIVQAARKGTLSEGEAIPEIDEILYNASSTERCHHLIPMLVLAENRSLTSFVWHTFSYSHYKEPEKLKMLQAALSAISTLRSRTERLIPHLLKTETGYLLTSFLNKLSIDTRYQAIESILVETGTDSLQLLANAGILPEARAIGMVYPSYTKLGVEFWERYLATTLQKVKGASLKDPAELKQWLNDLREIAQEEGYEELSAALGNTLIG